jgi:hypothetical protein
MSSSEGMVFFDTRLACPLLAAKLHAIPPMKSLTSSLWLRLVTRLIGAFTCLFPSLLLAHPGHYHPDETDEFDFLRAAFLHSHGAFDFVLIGLALASLTVVVLNGRPGLRISALAVGLASFSLLSIL